MVTLEQVKQHQLASGLIAAANDYLGAIGYTEHGFRHASLVAQLSRQILEQLGYSEPLPELAGISGYLHDVGNVVNRANHAWSGAIIAMNILKELGAKAEEIGYVVSAIGNHEEPSGEPVNPVAAAMILADKSDVNRLRVRSPQMIKYDIHDRVNFAVQRSFLKTDPAAKQIVLELTVDTGISQIMEYFEIFLERMTMCRRSAHFLGCSFGLIVNDTKMI